MLKLVQCVRNVCKKKFNPKYYQCKYFINFKIDEKLKLKDFLFLKISKIVKNKNKKDNNKTKQ